MDSGASSTSGSTPRDTSGAESIAITLDVRAAGAQGAIVWHPNGAQGRWQGFRSCSGACGVVAAGAAAPSMAMSAIAEAPLSLVLPIVGMAHITPLPISIAWSMMSTVVIANQRCGRLMQRNVVVQPNRRKCRERDTTVTAG